MRVLALSMLTMTGCATEVDLGLCDGSFRPPGPDWRTPGHTVELVDDKPVRHGDVDDERFDPSSPDFDPLQGLPDALPTEPVEVSDADWDTSIASRRETWDASTGWQLQHHELYDGPDRVRTWSGDHLEVVNQVDGWTTTVTYSRDAPDGMWGTQRWTGERATRSTSWHRQEDGELSLGSQVTRQDERGHSVFLGSWDGHIDGAPSTAEWRLDEGDAGSWWRWTGQELTREPRVRADDGHTVYSQSEDESWSGETLCSGTLRGEHLESSILSDNQSGQRTYMRLTRPTPDLTVIYDAIGDGDWVVRHRGERVDDTYFATGPAGELLTTRYDKQGRPLTQDYVVDGVTHPQVRWVHPD